MEPNARRRPFTHIKSDKGQPRLLRFLQRNSLAWRLFIASLCILPIVLGIIAFALNKAFKTSLITAEQEALQAHFYSLLGAAEPDEKGLLLPEVLDQPKFNLHESGLYAWIIDDTEKLIWQSESARLTLTLQPESFATTLTQGESQFFESDLSGVSYFIYNYRIVWEFDDGDHAFDFYLAHNTSALDKELKRYRRTLWIWLSLLALIILTAQWLIVRWGLSPLASLTRELHDFQQGKTSNIKGDYPIEISPVTDSLNLVLDSEKSQRQKYKNTLSDLAHSLKTPLAIVRSTLESQTPLTEPTCKATIDEQVNRMSEIIGHQLRRATSVSTNVNQRLTDLHGISTRLGNALEKVYRDKNISLTNNVQAEHASLIEEQDAMELIGNILENAFKYGNQRVAIHSAQTNEGINLTIDDDGPGVSKDKRSSILTRGARADTATSGQGIGLAISIDILSSYGGSLVINDSPLGGARFELLLPSH